MATKPKTTIGALPYQPVLPGEEIPEQNIASEQALENMMAALERRKQKPFFDPTLLSLAAGFLTPTKTGGFGESLGYAAQNLAGGMDAERKREAENIAFESGVLGQAAAIEQMKRRDKEFARLLGDTGERVPAGVEEIVVKGRGEQGKRISGSEVYTPPGLPPTMGVSFMPPNPNILTAEEYYRVAARDPKISAAEAVKTAQEIERNRYIDNERGVIDRRTGLRFEVTGSDLVERQIVDPDTGDTGTYKIPQNIAIRLDHNQLTGNRDVYDYYARVALGKRTGQPPRSADVPGASGPKVSGAVPPVSAGRTEVAQAPTSGLKSELQKRLEEERVRTIAKNEAEQSVKDEAELEAKDKTARDLFNAASRIQKAVNESPNVFGLLQAPTVGSAILTLIRDGIQAGNTSIKFGGFEKALILSYPGVDKDDITNLERAYSGIAEVTLNVRKLYYTGQGTITDREAAVAERVLGGAENTPQFLRQQTKLLQMRSQFDMDKVQKFRELKRQNPGITVLEFERSKEYEQMKRRYDENLGKAFNLEPALPSSQRSSKDPNFPDVKDFEKKLQQRRSQQ
jgi:ribosomal protein L9